MNSTGVIKHYIYRYSKNYYFITNNNVIFVYDYSHQLINQTKKIMGIIGTIISENEKVVFSVADRKYIYIWNFEKSTLDKINYTKRKLPSIRSIFDDKNYIYIHYSGFNNDKIYERDFVYIDKNTLEVGSPKINIIEDMDPNEIFINRNKMYYIKSEYIGSGKQDYTVFLKNKNNLEEILKTECSHDPVFQVTDDGKYALLASTYLRKSDGEIRIINFENGDQIDILEFYHIGTYRVIANFFSYNNQVYIIYQANPQRCGINKEIWHTYIYSISEKKSFMSFLLVLQ